MVNHLNILLFSSPFCTSYVNSYFTTLSLCPQIE
uniref:Uncharacterized protein n=1 Tax=Rhizophora mucronata TaxID=61149 RepID=A0A2P2QTJ0_RHIMU